MATTTFIPATEKQISWLTKMLAEKQVGADLRLTVETGLANNDLSKKAASNLLDILFMVANLPVAGAVTEPGFYRAADNTVYQVKKAKTTGNLYASQVTSNGFAYAQGVIKTLTATSKMTVDEIRVYGCETGICVNCSALLSDPISIFIGLGPTCGPSLMDKEAYLAAKHAAKADPATIEALAGKEALKKGEQAPTPKLELLPITCPTCKRKTATGVCCD